MEEIGGGPPGSPGLIDRVKGILLKPNDEWTKIDGEQSTVDDHAECAGFQPAATVVSCVDREGQSSAGGSIGVVTRARPIQNEM